MEPNAASQFAQHCASFYSSVIGTLATHLSVHANLSQINGKSVKEIGEILHRVAGVPQVAKAPLLPTGVPALSGGGMPGAMPGFAPAAPATTKRAAKQTGSHWWTLDQYKAFRAANPETPVCAYLPNRGGEATKGKVCGAPAINGSDANPLKHRCQGCLTKAGTIDKQMGAEGARAPPSAGYHMPAGVPSAPFPSLPTMPGMLPSAPAAPGGSAPRLGFVPPPMGHAGAVPQFPTPGAMPPLPLPSAMAPVPGFPSMPGSVAAPSLPMPLGIPPLPSAVPSLSLPPSLPVPSFGGAAPATPSVPTLGVPFSVPAALPLPEETKAEPDSFSAFENDHIKGIIFPNGNPAFANLAIREVDGVLQCLGRLNLGEGVVLAKDTPIPSDWYTTKYLVEITSQDKAFLESQDVEYKYSAITPEVPVAV